MFPILIPSFFRTRSCANFFLSFGCQHFHLYLSFISRTDMLYFQIKCSSYLFVEILSFGVCLLNSECVAYLPIDHSFSLQLSYFLLLFFSIILSEPNSNKTIFVDSYLGHVFVWFFAHGSSQLQKWNSVINFSHLVNQVFPFLFQNECQPIPETCD